MTHQKLKLFSVDELIDLINHLEWPKPKDSEESNFNPIDQGDEDRQERGPK